MDPHYPPRPTCTRGPLSTTTHTKSNTKGTTNVLSDVNDFKYLNILKFPHTQKIELYELNFMWSMYLYLPVLIRMMFCVLSLTVIDFLTNLFNNVDLVRNKTSIITSKIICSNFKDDY